ncbi:hypothetical protein [Polyangium mundeleinium]|uniref:Uncharacterized protein n=1 Tax=Polyangium mundeleinium TaxID=2995306 RepID=A0ABT5F158_9BACT|nr:hypothetical protein [Polyangium mundeleinium]MDC0747183.1 hypothetical protein [Polyangium mundeleinium]
MKATNMRTLATAQEAFTVLAESLLIAFRFEHDPKRFTLVCDFPPDEGAQRAFVGFLFTGVRGYTREAGDLAVNRKFQESYETRENPRAVVVQSIKASRRSQSGSLELWFGINFGGISFRYDHVTAFVRNAHVEKKGNDWIYRDAQTGECFDYADPFPLLRGCSTESG